MLALLKRINFNKKQSDEDFEVTTDSKDDTLDSFYEKTTNSQYVNSTTPEKLSDKVLLDRIKSLGIQKKIPMTTNIFMYYKKLHNKKQIADDLFELVMTLLSAPATQCSVERAFSG
jgi:hypothetical protein